MKRAGNLLVAGHVTHISGPVQALVAYLRRRKRDFIFLSLPFKYAGMPRAYAERYLSGKLAGTRQGHAVRGFEPWLWMKDAFFVLRVGFSGAGTFIGIDSLNAAAGLILRFLGRVDRVVFYVIDYTPRRFSNPVLNGVYHFIDRFCIRRADVIWNLSQRMRDVRMGQGVEDRRNQVVPVGVALDEIRHVSPRKVQRRALVYMGALHRSKGVQMLIEALPEVRKKAPGAKLHIFGLGDFEDTLKALAAGSPAKKAVFFHGPLDRRELFKVLPRYGVALAPYLEEPGSYTYWADATKPKEYLACGLPLIVTKVPWIWEAVADSRNPMGVAISYNRRELVEACARLIGDSKFYWRCRRNALRFAKGLDWSDIYDKAFSEMPG